MRAIGLRGLAACRRLHDEAGSRCKGVTGRSRHFSAGTGTQQPKRDWDLASAAEVLFTRPPVGQQRKLGLDWHLWQLVTALMPVGAVYAVAMYARSEQAELKRTERERQHVETMQAKFEPPLEILEVDKVMQRLSALEARMDAAEAARSGVNRSEPAQTVPERTSGKAVPRDS